MKTWNRFLRVGAVSLLLSLLTTTAFGQLASVSRYIVTSEPGTWTDATSGGTRLCAADDDMWTFSLPFDIVYDSTTVSANTQIGMSDDGDFSLKNPTGYNYNYCGIEVGQSGFPGYNPVFNIDWNFANSAPAGDWWSVTGTSPNRILTMEWYDLSLIHISEPTRQAEIS